jgi:serine/threonine protein kinase
VSVLHPGAVQAIAQSSCVPACSRRSNKQQAGSRHAGFSVVKLAEELATGDVFACKIMALPPLGSRTADGESTREDIFKEIEILVGLNDINVVYLKEYFQENEKVRRGVRRSKTPCLDLRHISMQRQQ